MQGGLRSGRPQVKFVKRIKIHGEMEQNMRMMTHTIMFAKKDKIPKDLLAATNPWSVHRKFHVLKWAIVFGVVFCIGFGCLLYLLNRYGRF